MKYLTCFIALRNTMQFFYGRCKVLFDDLVRLLQPGFRYLVALVDI